MKENSTPIKNKATYTDTKVVDLKHIHKQYDGEPVLKDINLYIRDKEFVTLLGPSGCGKSTLLKALEAGVYDHIAGDGREFVLTDETAMKIRAEDGRSVKNTDISLL